MVNQIYLAARYSRRIELVSYRDILRSAGFTVQARWLDGEHQIDDKGVPIRDSGEALVEGTLRSGERLSEHKQSDRATALRQKFATDDFDDVMACRTFIAFTEVPRSGHSRGGRHVELGIALALGTRVVIIGPRENIFCWLPHVYQFDDWHIAFQSFLNHLSR